MFVNGDIILGNWRLLCRINTRFFFLNAIFEMNETERKLGTLLFVSNGVNKYSFDINSNVAAFNFHCK